MPWVLRAVPFRLTQAIDGAKNNHLKLKTFEGPMPVLGNKRRFAHAPGHDQVHHMSTSVDHTPYQDDSHFEDFPSPPGERPYRLDLGEILHKSEMDQITGAKKLVFHTTGDTGNFKNDLQIEVASLLQQDAEASNAKFLYH